MFELTHIKPGYFPFSYEPWLLVYEGDDDDQNKGDQNKDDKNKGNPPPPQNDDDKPTISNKKFNAIMAEEKRRTQKQVQDLTGQLEQLKQTAGMSENAKKELEAKIEELNNSLLTKEELAKKEKEKLEVNYKKQLDSEKGEKETWKSRYTEAIITRSITDAAANHKALRPSQIVALLERKTRLVEVEEDGKLTGQFIAKIKFPDKDKEGKDIVLDLTVDECVKRMKELPDEYGNLFESTLAGGVGGAGHKGSGGRNNKAPQDMNDAEYAAWRKEQGLKK